MRFLFAGTRRGLSCHFRHKARKIPDAGVRSARWANRNRMNDAEPHRDCGASEEMTDSRISNRANGATETIGLDRMAVIGASAWGTALAITAARAGRAVRLCAREPEALTR
jgi:hypothetical protein